MRKYAIIRCQRTRESGIRETVERTGLTWTEADRERDKLQHAERLAHPNETTWTIALFHVRLESTE